MRFFEKTAITGQRAMDALLNRVRSYSPEYVEKLKDMAGMPDFNEVRSKIRPYLTQELKPNTLPHSAVQGLVGITQNSVPNVIQARKMTGEELLKNQFRRGNVLMDEVKPLFDPQLKSMNFKDSANLLLSKVNKVFWKRL